MEIEIKDNAIVGTVMVPEDATDEEVAAIVEAAENYLRSIIRHAVPHYLPKDTDKPSSSITKG